MDSPIVPYCYVTSYKQFGHRRSTTDVKKILTFTCDEIRHNWYYNKCKVNVHFEVSDAN